MSAEAPAATTSGTRLKKSRARTRDEDESAAAAPAIGARLEKCVTPNCTNPRRRRHRRCPTCSDRAWRARRPAQAAYNLLRNHARERGIEFTIPFEDFAAFARESGYLEQRGRSLSSLTVDRIDNERGYERGNLQALTKSANTHKANCYDTRREWPRPIVRRSRKLSPNTMTNMQNQLKALRQQVTLLELFAAKYRLEDRGDRVDVHDAYPRPKLRISGQAHREWIVATFGVEGWEREFKSDGWQHVRRTIDGVDVTFLYAYAIQTQVTEPKAVDPALLNAAGAEAAAAS